MKGSKAVYGLVDDDRRNGVVPTNAFEMALVDGLREITKIQKIFYETHLNVSTLLTPIFSWSRTGNQFLCRPESPHGRMLLRLSERSEPPNGVGPRLLAKLTSPHDTSVLFYYFAEQDKNSKVQGSSESKAQGKQKCLVGVDLRARVRALTC
jgi:hypothetical protein